MTTLFDASPAVRSLLVALLSVPGQRWLVLHFRMPTGDAETSPSDDQVPVATLRFGLAPDATITTEQGEPGAEQLLSALAMGLASGGSLTLRQELDLKVQRMTPTGMAWEPQERLYGVELADQDWVPVSEGRLKRSFAFDPASGKALPAVAGRSFGVLKKPRRA